MKKHFLVTFPAIVLLSMFLCTAVQADQLVGLGSPDVVGGVVDGNEVVVSLTYAGTEYVVADGALVTGTTTRWYIPASTGVETQWVDGDPVQPEMPTVAGTSNPKVGDHGWKADNFTFRVPSWTNDICSIDGIDFMQTVFESLSDTFFVFERNGNDNGTVQAIRSDGSLGPALTLTGGGSPYAATGISVGDQDAYGFVLITDAPAKGLRITASGFDALSISIPSKTIPLKAHDPKPEHKEKGILVAGLTLSWKAGLDPADPNNPNPDIEKHYLWVTKPYDPMNPPGGPDWGDPAVQTFTIGADTDPPDGSVDPNASKAVPGLQKDSLYFWAVDEGLVGSTGPEDPTNIWGDTWIFETETTGPEVDAGSSVVTWLKAGATIVDVNGTVTDGSGDVTTILWSVLSSPPGSTVDIADDSVAVTTATFTQTGLYILQLYAKDATLQEDSDRIEVRVYADSCEAAKNSPYGYTAPLYDFNNDCIVDFNDFTLFAARWLEDASLMSDLLYDAGEITLPVVQFTNPLDSSTVSGVVIINAIAYDPGVGTTDGDGMLGAGYVFFEIIDTSGTVLDTQNENVAAFDMTWDTALPLYPNGIYTIRVTAESDAGYQTIKEISVTVNNP